MIQTHLSVMSLVYVCIHSSQIGSQMLLCTCLTLFHEVSFVGLRGCTCIVVPATVCRPCSVLVEAQAIGRDGRRAVVAQRGRTAGPAVHILHVHATVAAGQVVLTNPAEQTHAEKHTYNSDLFIYVRVSARNTMWWRAM